PPWASLMRSASSTAFRSVGLRVASPERSSRFVDGSIRLCTVASGTCFTQTAIFIGADSIGGRGAVLRGTAARHLLASGPSRAHRSAPRMRRHRTTAVLLVLAGLVAITSATPASGRQSGAVPRLVFPLVAKTDLWDNYG